MAKAVTLTHVRNLMPAFFNGFTDEQMLFYFRYCPCCGKRVE